MNRALIVILIWLASQALAMPSLRAETNEPHRVPRIEGSMKLDGQLDEPLWQSALLLELKYETSSGENTPAPVKTEVLLAYSESALLIGFRCYDPEPSAIRARLSDRDNDPGDDYVGVILDTFNDQRRSYILWSNPLGVQEDGILTNDGYDSSWDAIYESRGRITDWGWSLEMRVPFSSISFQRTEGPQVWGFDVIRNYPRGVTHEMRLSPFERGNNCELCQFAKIEGFEGVKPGLDLEINPTVTYVRTSVRPDFPEGDFETTHNEAEVGLTTQWGVTPNINLAATLNPDFSQVEADAWQLDINEPFALYYEEKRPFFTEGADFLASELEVVYSRTVRDPSVGFKISGKEGGNSIGGFVVRDEVTNLIFPGSLSSDATTLAGGSWSSAFRYKRDIGGKYTLGALFTGRTGDEYHNAVLGVDGEFRFTDNDRFYAQVLRSNTSYPQDVSTEFGQPEDNFSGNALHFLYHHSARDLSLVARFEDIAADFRADLGYMPKVDYRHYQVGADYRIWNDLPDWWRVLLLGGGFHHYADHEGDLLQKNAYGMIVFRGGMNSGVDLFGYKRVEAYGGREFDLTQGTLDAWILPSSKYALEFSAMFGDRIDYANVRPGGRLRLNPIITFTPDSRLSVGLDHTYERMTVDGGRLYTANVSQLTLKYQLSVRAFFRAIFQYVDYDFNADLYANPVDPKFRQLFTQLLFSYKLNPRTVFFLGYTDNYYGARDNNLTQESKTLFMKIGYAWQL
jgi:hypothetical protein